MHKIFSFELVSTLAAVLCSLLCFTLLFVPDLIYWLFELVASNSANLLAKRAAMLFLGLAVLLLATRKTQSGEVVSAVSLSMVVAFCGLIVVGCYEYISCTAGPGIWVAIVGEAFFIFMFLIAWHKFKKI